MCHVDLPSKLTMDEQSARSLNVRTECIHARSKILKENARFGGHHIAHSKLLDVGSQEMNSTQGSNEVFNRNK